MLLAAIGRVNARAGEERRMVPERDEKTLINTRGESLVLLCGHLSACSTKILGNVLNLPFAAVAFNLSLVV